MSTVGQGGTIRLSVQYYEFAGGPKYDPDQPITLDILYGGVSVLGSPIQYNPGDIQREALGFYSYVWTAPAGATIGNYTARWYGVIHGAPVFGDELFSVVAAGSVDPGSGSAQTLGENVFVTFASVLDPMYIDPDEILVYFSDSNYLEVAELVHIASLEVKSYLKLTDDEDPSIIGLEYVKAATLCSLSRVYPNSTTGSGSGFAGGASSVKLGDFSVEYGGGGGNSFSVSGSSNRGNAKDWCELAEALRKEMLFTSVGMKAVVRGSKYVNPIPTRKVSAFTSRSEDYYDKAQGLLDGH